MAGCRNCVTPPVTPADPVYIPLPYAYFTYIFIGEQKIRFSAYNPQPGETFAWNFGDGGTGSGTVVEHEYEHGTDFTQVAWGGAFGVNAGKWHIGTSHNVQLTVTGAGGSSSNTQPVLDREGVGGGHGGQVTEILFHLDPDTGFRYDPFEPEDNRPFFTVSPDWYYSSSGTGEGIYYLYNDEARPAFGFGNPPAQWQTVQGWTVSVIITDFGNTSTQSFHVTVI